MTDPSNILNYYGNTNSEFLHSKGRFATKILLQRLDCGEKENILDLGFGTGATLVFLSSVYKKANFYGIEFDPLMYKKALSRIRFCFSKNICLALNTNRTSLPFPDNYFDKLYTESVLGIQEGDDLNLLIMEVYRILKPGGKFVINEAIWLNSVSQEKINEINSFCKSKFGIIQANDKYPYLSDWATLLQSKGFTIESAENIDEIIDHSTMAQPVLNKTLSDIFSFYGKIKSKINPKFKKQHSTYTKEMNALSNENQYLHGIIIKSKK